MKRCLPFLLILLSTKLLAQVPEDAVRYSWYPHNGTARNMAIGGVMGSLGGDLTATYVNPAGLGFYKTSEAVITPGLFMNNNKAVYRETPGNNQQNAFSFGPSGVIIGSVNRYIPGKSSAVSFAISQTANFNKVIRYQGLNNFSSFSEQFAEEFAKSFLSIGQVLNSNSPLPYTAAPALYTYLIDTVTINGQLQVKAAPEYLLDSGKSLLQEMNKTSSGGIYELAIGYAENHHDKWLWGATLGIPIVNYHSKTTFTESDISGDTSNRFNSFTYTDDFTTKGAGLNARFGVIYRPQEYFRLGLAVHTPSWMLLTDTRTTSLSTSLENPVNDFQVNSLTFTNNQPGESRYFQSTAWKAILSASYVFREVENVKRQRGFISADIEYVNHRGSRFSSHNEQPTEEETAYYNGLNKVVKNEYKGNFNFRVGGELKFNVIMARMGFAYYSNPYKDEALKASRMMLSGGLGYRNKGFFIDLTYVHNIAKQADLPYRLEDRENTFASIKQLQGNIVATVGIKL